MSELELYKYIKDLEPEIRWSNDELLVFLYYFQVEDFVKDVIEPSGALEDGGLEAFMKSGYMVLDLVPVCDCLDINPESILPKEPES